MSVTDRDRQVAWRLYDRAGNEVDLADLESGIASYRGELQAAHAREVEDLKAVLKATGENAAIETKRALAFSHDVERLLAEVEGLRAAIQNEIASHDRFVNEDMASHHAHHVGRATYLRAALAASGSGEAKSCLNCDSKVGDCTERKCSGYVTNFCGWRPKPAAPEPKVEGPSRALELLGELMSYDNFEAYPPNVTERVREFMAEQEAALAQHKEEKA